MICVIIQLDIHVSFTLYLGIRYQWIKFYISKRTMKKIIQYLPFILWSVSTIILTVIGFIIVPVLLLWEKLQSLFKKKVVTPRVLLNSQIIVNYSKNI
jgi:hypothetical protein